MEFLGEPHLERMRQALVRKLLIALSTHNVNDTKPDVSLRYDRLVIDIL